MGVGDAVIAHDNRFNRWVAREGALYFSDMQGCVAALDQALASPELREQMGRANRDAAASGFDGSLVLAQYAMTMRPCMPAQWASWTPRPRRWPGTRTRSRWT